MSAIFPSFRKHPVKSSLIWLFRFAVIAVMAGGLLWSWTFLWLPRQDPQQLFTESMIRELLRGETRVFYRDGETILGTYFDVNHRYYVPYDSIPLSVIDGLVAGEDENFFSHSGFSYTGFARALVANIKAGRVVQGGSTLSQQTAKNLFGRKERSLQAKWNELINALRLEHRFSKEEILEFYLNQFYVSGTGRGVGIAAWYFFSKELRELTLKESAFIAGSVKGPSLFDPFIKRDSVSRQLALDRGKERSQYILRRMKEAGSITDKEYQQALNDTLQFVRGDFRFSLSTPLARIQSRLEDSSFVKLFDSLGIESWQDHQLKIISTLSPELHEECEQAVKRNLSALQMKLEGQRTLTDKRYSFINSLPQGHFARGRVDSVSADSTSAGKKPILHLSFGPSRGSVSHQELIRFIRKNLQSRHRWKQYSNKALNDSLQLWLKNHAHRGQVLLVQTLEPLSRSSQASLRIENDAEIQGALVVMKNGEIRSSVGGFRNDEYDRASLALRQFGSSWKPPLYALALRLGWTYGDPLENEWNMFRQGYQFYFPRPDHKNKGETVSMIWAGTKSENIASVWLLTRLLDKAHPDTVKALARKFGYFPQEGDGNQRTIEYLRDSLGLIFNDRTRNEMLLEAAKDGLRTDWILEGRQSHLRYLDWLHYGDYPSQFTRTHRRDPKKRRMIDYNWVNLLPRLAKLDTARFTLDLLLSPAEPDTVIGDLKLAELLPLYHKWKELKASPDQPEFTLQWLLRWRQWKQSLAMQVFADFLHQAGVRRQIRPVLSMPLGSNEIPLTEMTTVYQTLLSGHVYRNQMNDWKEPVWIQEIQNSSGKVLYRSQMDSLRILPPEVTEQMAIILESVVDNGTGRRARQQLRYSPPESSSPLFAFPAMGKTGTTNGSRNAAFLGGLPSWDSSSGGFNPARPWVIGSYAGYDDNRPMRGKGVVLSGASAALPQWIEAAEKVIQTDSLLKHVDYWDLDLQINKIIPMQLKHSEGFSLRHKLYGYPLGHPLLPEEQRGDSSSFVPVQHLIF